MPYLHQNASPVPATAAGGRTAFLVIAVTSRAEGIQLKCSCLAIRIKKATAREHLEQEEVRNQCTQPATAALIQTFVLVKKRDSLVRNVWSHSGGTGDGYGFGKPGTAN